MAIAISSGKPMMENNGKGCKPRPVAARRRLRARPQQGEAGERGRHQRAASRHEQRIEIGDGEARRRQVRPKITTPSRPSRRAWRSRLSGRPDAGSL